MAKSLGIFETQRRSDWFRGMYMSVGNDIGSHEYTWGQRALMALKVAGCEGSELTAAQIHDCVAPYVGENPPMIASMIVYGKSKGVLVSTGERRPYSKARRLELAYEVKGHMIPTDKVLYNKPHPEAILMEGL